MNNLTQLREQHKIDNWEYPNKYEEAIYKVLVKEEVIDEEIKQWRYLYTHRSE